MTRKPSSAVWPFFAWTDLALKTSEMMMASSSVIAHRTGRMARASTPPDRRDQREFTMMVEEKKQAMQESTAATAKAMMTAGPELAIRSAQQAFALSTALMSAATSGKATRVATAEPGMSLEAAQVAKKDHIAAKLLLSPGQRVLDIGCGWGGMALHLARTAQADVTGVTLSEEQLAVAQARAHAPDVEEHVHFELRDYREVEGVFDRIVSVGMFEHVGLAGFQGYFRTVRDRLSDDGVALIHTIGRRAPTGGRNPWLEKYIFPGGYIPSLSEIVEAAEASDLWISDIEPLRLHYAETLRCWRERFMEHRSAVAEMYDERFCRMWEFYLAFCELGFRYGDLVVFQVQLTRRRDTAPLTRDYMLHAENDRGVSPNLQTGLLQAGE